MMTWDWFMLIMKLCCFRRGDDLRLVRAWLWNSVAPGVMMTWDWFMLNYGTLLLPAWWWLETGSCLIMETLSWLYFQAVLFCEESLYFIVVTFVVLPMPFLCCSLAVILLHQLIMTVLTSLWSASRLGSWICSSYYPVIRDGSNKV